MSNPFSIQDTTENKISYLHLAVFVMVLPFDRFYSELVLISLLLHTIIHINKERCRRLLSIQNLILCSVFLLGVVGTVYSTDKTQGLKDLQRQMAILLFPLILSATGLDLSKYRDRLLKILGLTCIIAILYLYGDAMRVIMYYKLPLRSLFSSSFINHNFSEPIHLHATYFSMFISLAMAAFTFFLLKEKDKRYQLLYVLAIGILLAGMVQLASRAVLIITMVLILPGIGFLLLRGAKRLRFAGIWLMILGMAVITVSKLHSFKKRYVENLKNDLTQASVNNEVLEPRLLRWEYVWRLVTEKPVIGHGSGSEKRLLQETYYNNKLYNSFLHELNAHNQYLSILLKYGFIGLIIYLSILVYGYTRAWRQKDIMLAAFLALISVVSFSENILDVNKGIFFYAFFLSVLLKSNRKKFEPRGHRDTERL